MLYVNNKFLNPNSKDEELQPFIEEYKKGVAQLKRQYGNVIHLKHKKEYKGLKINPTGRAEAIPIRTLPLISIAHGEHGTEEWVYTETAPTFKDGEMHLENRQKIVRSGEMFIDIEKDPDLAYFIVYKHEMFRTGKYMVYDNREIARTRADEFRMKSKVEGAIFGEFSPLNTNLKELKIVARRWGIEGVDNKTKDEIQVELHDAVIEMDKRSKKMGQGRGIEDFLEDAKVRDDTRVGSMVYEAIEHGIIVFNHRHNLWETSTDDGTPGNMLLKVSVPELNFKEEVLVSEVSSNPRTRAILENAMGSEVNPDDVITFTMEDLEETDDYKWMQRKAKELGINGTGMKKEDLRNRMIEEMHKRETQTA